MKKLLLALTIIATAIIGVQGVAKADVNNFTITNFSSNQTLSNQNKAGKLEVTEKIKVYFTDYNHGIYRNIPVDYKGHKLGFKLDSISSSSGAPTKVVKSKQNGNEVLKIGDANRTITGSQEYTIKYSLTNVIRFFDNHDELYIDVNGTGWDQSVGSLNVTVNLPSGLKIFIKIHQIGTAAVTIPRLALVI